MQPVAPDRFPATRGSAILGTRSADPAERARSLEVIAGLYWRPVYTYVRLRWSRTAEDAEDLTQEFFARALTRDFLAAYDPARARFRTFLRVCVDRLVANHDRDALRLKRGGAVTLLPLDFAAVEAELARARSGPPAPSEIETFFEREWARAVFSQAVEALRAECAAADKSVHFRLFERYDIDDPGPDGHRPSYADLGRELGIKPTDVTNRLAWARSAFRRLTLATLRALTASDEEFRREAKALLGIDTR